MGLSSDCARGVLKSAVEPEASLATGSTGSLDNVRLDMARDDHAVIGSGGGPDDDELGCACG